MHGGRIEALSGMGFFRKNHRKILNRKDLSRNGASSILTVDNLRDGWEMHHVSPRPLVRLDEGTDEDLSRLEQATTQRAGRVVLRDDPGTLLFFGPRRLLHGRLAGTARTLRPQPFARVVFARRPQ